MLHCWLESCRFSLSNISKRQEICMHLVPLISRAWLVNLAAHDDNRSRPMTIWSSGENSLTLMLSFPCSCSLPEHWSWTDLPPSLCCFVCLMFLNRMGGSHGSTHTPFVRFFNGSSYWNTQDIILWESQRKKLLTQGIHWWLLYMD